MELDKKINTYTFVIIVLAFVLVMHLISTSQMKFTVNKILENQTRVEEPVKIIPKVTTTPTGSSSYQNY